ncbi:MAG: MarR family transcriptional regulator [Candidatus Omnitrophota bacterium]|nr:MarR family transcriptional regulator [Candidatus Omnitrophota bacterium]
MGKTDNQEMDSFYKEMAELMPKLMRQFLKKGPSALARGNISMPHIFILGMLNEKGSCNMSEIAGELAITTSAVTGLVDRMLKLGLVERIRGEEDRRVVKVKATKKGKNTINKIISQRREMMMKVFSQISSQDREKYMEILRKIYLALEKTGNKKDEN